MSDITKLPKWAQAYIADRRVFETHLWPQFERPEAVDTSGASYSNMIKAWREGHECRPTEEVVERANRLYQPDYYATRLDALKATRWRMAEECARKLARIDALIEEERAKAAKEQA